MAHARACTVCSYASRADSPCRLNMHIRLGRGAKLEPLTPTKARFETVMSSCPAWRTSCTEAPPSKQRCVSGSRLTRKGGWRGSHLMRGAISGHQRSSSVIIGHQIERAGGEGPTCVQADPLQIRGHQRSSEVIRGHQPTRYKSEVIRRTRWHSVALGGTWRHSDAPGEDSPFGH